MRDRKRSPHRGECQVTVALAACCGLLQVGCASGDTPRTSVEASASPTLPLPGVGPASGGAAGVNGAGAGSAGLGGAGLGGAGLGGTGLGGAGAGGSGLGGTGPIDSVGGSSGKASTPGDTGLTLTSPALNNSPECSDANLAACSVFPDENTSYMGNLNVSPELSWSGAPPGTLSFVVTFKDVSFGQPHWALWNIPGDVTTLPADVPQDSSMPGTPVGAMQASATFSETKGYLGPQAPCNVYQFELWALSVASFSPADSEYVALVVSELEQLGDVVLARATLTARNNYMMTCE